MNLEFLSRTTSELLPSLGVRDLENFKDFLYNDEENLREYKSYIFCIVDSFKELIEKYGEYIKNFNIRINLSRPNNSNDIFLIESEVRDKIKEDIDPTIRKEIDEFINQNLTDYYTNKQIICDRWYSINLLEWSFNDKSSDDNKYIHEILKISDDKDQIWDLFLNFIYYSINKGYIVNLKEE